MRTAQQQRSDSIKRKAEAKSHPYTVEASNHKWGQSYWDYAEAVNAEGLTAEIESRSYTRCSECGKWVTGLRVKPLCTPCSNNA